MQFTVRHSLTHTYLYLQRNARCKVRLMMEREGRLTLEQMMAIYNNLV